MAPSIPTAPLVTAADPLVIEAGRSSRHYWRDLWRYRELLWFLAWRDIKVRYKQTALGVAWAVIQPAVQTVLLTFVFSKLARMPDGGLPYPLLVLAGLLPWQLFSTAFSSAGNSLVTNSHLVTKVYFPRLIVPLSALAVALIDLAILLVITLPIAAILGVPPSWRLLLLPAFIAAALLIALGAGLWITALTVKYRDFRFITPFLLQVGLFVTPVGFRTDYLPNWRDLLALNPLTGVVNGFRWCLLNGDTDFYGPGFAVSLIMAAVLVVTGLWYFRRTERQFADVI
ncbi:MAG: phosphate ABC transporter permease [Verrucomicrobia bacterium RIFCSPLOWO2_12_FULL_64_8]|nr:MAG: phosphate ABC transporter permease [Verrucomicrobia bacterium RIFCSPLOWO2_12_FULL_64_8]